MRSATDKNSPIVPYYGPKDQKVKSMTLKKPWYMTKIINSRKYGIGQFEQAFEYLQV